MERTLIILKADAVQRGLCGQILARFEQKGLQIVAMKFLKLPTTLVETHYSKAEPGTIRGDFGVSNAYNLVHGSDSPEAAARELALFFKPEEFTDWQPASRAWLYDMAKGTPE